MIKLTESFDKEKENIKLLLEIDRNIAFRSIRLTETVEYSYYSRGVDRLRARAYKMFNDAYIELKSKIQDTYEFERGNFDAFLYDLKLSKETVDLFNGDFKHLGARIYVTDDDNDVTTVEEATAVVHELLERITGQLDDVLDLLNA